MKFYLAQINTIVGDIKGNCDKILRELKIAEEQNCDLIIFPEMVLSGYPAQDLWLKKYFIEENQEKINEISIATKSCKCAILLGCPYVEKDKKYNAVFLIEKGEIKNIIRKKSLPNYGVFDEKRYFTPANILSYIEFRGKTLSILICEDFWDDKNLYLLKEQIFDFVIVINSSPFEINKQKARKSRAKQLSSAIKKPLIYVNQIGAEDGIIFDGNSFIINSDGDEVLNLKAFEEDVAIVDSDNLIFQVRNSAIATKIKDQNFELNDVYQACVLGLRDYIYKNNFQKILIGMSGGIDSALVATIAVDAFGFENVVLYALPSRYNSDESMQDALFAAKNLNIKLEIISIEEIFSAMLLSLDNQGLSNLAKENLQARIRGNILMSISNTTNALLLSTGNKSELATGYATIYGDMCGAFNPIKDLYKTQIFELAKWRNENIPEISVYKKNNLIPQNIIAKEPTAELRDNQKDSDSLPPYQMLDAILYQIIEEQKSLADIIKMGFAQDVVEKIAKMFYNSEYKRKQAVIGCKISKMSFDKDRRYPITNKFLK